MEHGPKSGRLATGLPATGAERWVSVGGSMMGAAVGGGLEGGRAGYGSSAKILCSESTAAETRQPSERALHRIVGQRDQRIAIVGRRQRDELVAGGAGR